MSASFIDCALTINKRVLTIPACAELLRAMDDVYGTRGPFDSVFKIQVIINRSKTPSAIAWVLECVVDQLRMQQLEVGDFNTRKLDSLHCPVAMLKYQFHEYFLTTFIDKHPFALADKAKLRSVFADHQSIRTNLTARPGETDVEIAWRSKLAPSSNMVCELIEGICFGDAHDASLRTGVKYHKSVEDVLDYNLVKEEVAAILDTLQKEQHALAGANPLPGAAGTEQDPAKQEQAAADKANAETEKHLYNNMQESIDKLDDEAKALWTAQADKLCRQYTRVVVHPQTEKQLVQDIGSSDLGTARGDGSGTTLLHFDVKLSAESITAPRLRIAPFQEKVYEKVVAAIKEARDCTGKLIVGDCVLLIDGGKPGDARHLKRPWMPVSEDDEDDDDDDDVEDGTNKDAPGRANLSEVCLHMEEASLRKRRRLTRNTASLKQTESMYVLTSGALSLPERASLHYSGTNKGTVLGPIVMGDLENDWSMTVKDTEPLCIRTAM